MFIEGHSVGSRAGRIDLIAEQVTSGTMSPLTLTVLSSAATYFNSSGICSIVSHDYFAVCDIHVNRETTPFFL